MKAGTTFKVVSSICGFAAACTAGAVDYVWTPQSALWLDANWNSGLSWVDGNTAVFNGSAPSSVTVGGDVEAYDVKVNGADYTFSGTGKISIPNGFFEVAAGHTATVSCGLDSSSANYNAVTNRLRKSGDGTLLLKNATTTVDRYLHLTGDTVVDGGTFTITSSLSSADVGRQPFILANSGRFEVTGGAVVKLKGGYAMNAGIEVAVTNGILDFTGLGGEFLNAFYPTFTGVNKDNRGAAISLGTPAVLTVQDKGIVSGGTFRVSQGGAGRPNGGVVNLNTNGVLALNYFKNDSAASLGSINFNGGTLVRKGGSGSLFSANADNKWDGISINVMEGGLYFQNDISNTTTFNKPLLGGVEGGRDGGVHVNCKNDDLVAFTAENSYNGGTSIGKGNIVINTDASLGAVPDSPEANFTFCGGEGYLRTLENAGTVNVHANRRFAAAEGASARFAAAAGSALVLHSATTAPDTPLRVIGNTSTYTGVVAFDPGEGNTNTFKSLAPLGNVELRSGALELKAAGVDVISFDYDQLTGYSDVAGRLTIAGADVRATEGKYLLNRYYGQLSISNSVVDLTGTSGILNSHGNKPSRIDIYDGGVLITPYFRITQSRNKGGAVSLHPGSELRMPAFVIDEGQKYPFHCDFVCDGGKVVTTASAASFFGSYTEYYTNLNFIVKSGGITFDTNGLVTRVYPKLVGDGESGEGLTKWGGYYLILHGANTYAGATRVMEGFLRLSNATGVLPERTTLIVNTNAVCEAYSDWVNYVQINPSWVHCTQTVARVEGCGSVTHSRYVTVTDGLAPGMGAGGIGTLTFEEAGDLNGRLEIDVGEEGADCLVVESGTLDLSKLSLAISAPASFAPSGRGAYRILSAPDGTTGEFADVSFSGSANWKLAVSGGDVSLRYVRGTAISLR